MNHSQPVLQNCSSHQALGAHEKIPCGWSIAKQESSSTTNHLRRVAATGACGRIKHPRKSLVRRRAAKSGWTPERRAAQAALIRRWQPWRSSTGPKTEAGKARCARNALKHGRRSLAVIREFQRIRRVLRMVEQNIKTVRAFIRLRDARLPRRSCYAAKAGPRIKYKPWYVAALRSSSSLYKPCSDRAAVLSDPPRGPIRDSQAVAGPSAAEHKFHARRRAHVTSSNGTRGSRMLYLA
jgi:hypothetical protein